MGFDSKKFVGLKTASTDERLTDGISNDTYLLSNNTDLNGRLDELQLCKYFLPFEAPMGWRGYT